MFFGNYSFPVPGSSYSFCYHFVHDHYMHVIFFSVFFIFMVLSFLFYGGLTFKFSGKFSDGRIVELFMEVMVINFLIMVVGPGFWLIHFQAHSIGKPDLNVKVLGHQWYWSYEYADLPGLVFDSFMKPSDELVLGDYRLLEVDNRCVLPLDLNVGFYCSSTDVIHSFCVPKCSFKVDVFNGLLSTFCYCFTIPGVYYGQCSELCGSGHSFMPIVLEVNSLECWKVWAFSYFD